MTILPFRLTRFALIASLALLGAGCSSWFESEDNAEPPTPLEVIDSKLNVSFLWQVGVGGSVDDGVTLRPAIVGDTLFAAGSDGRVTAIDVNSGAVRWQAALNTLIAGGVAADAEIAVVSTLQGEVVALSSRDGSEVWRANVGAEVLAPAAIAANRTVLRGANGKLFGIDSQNGQIVWQFDRKVPPLSLRGTSSPQVSGDFVAAGFDNGKLVVLRLSDGVALWERSVAVSSGRTEIDRMVDLDGDPVIEGGAVYATAFQGRTLAMDLRSGRVGWASDTSSHTGLALGRARLILADPDSVVWALDRSNGELLWKQTDLRARAITAPGVQAGYAVFVDFDGFVHWVSMESGFIEGRIKVANLVKASKPLAVGDRVYIQSQAGNVVALAAR